ncbi:DEAD/DEAH box helicase [Cellulomonas citrea]|uniref:DEAD/DEAH box helicase n=1 Tax=Cellulomonas citrea TaxID=1909423 RepID=UPI00135B783E|nr:type ISP restriction/modification enzyme [Cellulomonas citrea]
MTTLEDVLDQYLFKSTSTSERGTKFERLVQSFLKVDTQWSALYDEVWTWNQWPEHHGHDTGIDLVARERDTGRLVAVQCKFYDSGTTIQKQHIDSFLSESGKHPFAGRLVVTTTDKWGPNAEQAISRQQIPVQRIGLTDLLDSSIDWSLFDPETPAALTVKARKELMAHQRTALEKVRDGLALADRGKLVMACGTGKTLTSLRIAEDLVPLGGSVLFLVPSIALLSQALKEWSIEAQHSLRAFAVCSDSKAGQFEEDITTVDLPIPPTTSAARLAAAAGDGKAHGRLTVVFSTYQSIDVIAQAQAQGLGAFDLVICDEAHRTTGVTLAGEDAEESAFVKVHDAAYLQAAKRLYMTATPRIYDDASKAKAGQAQAVVASMDNEDQYGKELYRLGFGEAVTRNLLTDYKVLVLAVDEGTISRTMQASLTDPANSELKLDDVAKIVGCWNGLAKRGATEHDFGADPEPMRRAVAFSRSIKDSRRFTERFASIVADYQQYTGLRDEVAENPDEFPLLPAAVEHVDGSYNMVARNGLLAWLKAEDPDGGCRILSNAKCLSEGVDVPALDAVLFLNPRKSQVDVVQSVGRVMRRSPGKKYGYIILPIVVPAGVSPEDALRDNERYRVVWEVLQALRAHDERFDAMVNKIELNKARDARINVIGIGGPEPDEHSTNAADKGTQGWFDLDALGDFRAALYAKLVQKVGSRRYWEQWAADVAVIAEKHRERLVGLLAAGHAADEFEHFHAALRANLNESISREDAIDMLSQHLITAPVFSALFADYDFATHNPVSQVMEHMLQALEGTNLEAETASLDAFYESVRGRVAGIDNAAGRQTIIKDLYERFFKLAFPRAADQLGIVYTPVEIVDFIIRSVDHLLRAEFGASLSDEGVHVLDPFTGTGTFIVRLIQSGLIAPHDLARKYATELHANEIMLLAYYIAAINIESAYHDAIREAVDPGEPYRPFDGIVLTDTFQMHEDGDLDDGAVFTANSDRVIAQRALDIRVIIGNPPYSVGQTSANDNAANLKYATLDAKIAATYDARSSAKLRKSLLDSYVRAIRWASDRVGDQGVIGFVTNGGFIDSNSADGLRKTLADEFASVYVYNLRGNQRSAGEQSRREGGKVFGAGSRNTVAITFLIKRQSHRGRALLRYRDIGDYLTREEKLRVIGESTIDALNWSEITPNEAGDWTNQRSGDFGAFTPVADRQEPGLLAVFSGGIKTNRDSWVYSYSEAELVGHVKAMIAEYNSQLAQFAAECSRSGVRDRRTAYGAFIQRDPRRISWDGTLEHDFIQGKAARFEPSHVRVGAYRPFTRQRVYFDRQLNNSVYRQPSLFPSATLRNVGFQVVAPGSDKPFSVLAVDLLPDLSVWGSGPSQFFPRWTYEKVEGEAATQGAFDWSDTEVVDGCRRIDNVTDACLRQYRTWYGPDVTKDEIFSFLYGFLHSPDYRVRFAADLKRTLPRIPRIAADDFAFFVTAGRRLLDVHIGYEDAEPYPLTITGDQPAGPGSADRYEWFRVEKLRWGGKGRDADKSTIFYNPRITVSGIPDAAHRYMLGSRSALEWVIDRYRVTTDKASGITNDPNDWSREVGNPRYILDLIAKVTTVSVETMRIVDGLPPLRVHEDQS